MVFTEPEQGVNEQILVCLSPAPANLRVLRIAAQLAKALHGSLTALYVEIPAATVMQRQARERLALNMREAQRLGARLVTVSGADIPYQIAEYARIAKATRVVLGRSGGDGLPFPRKTVTEQLIRNAPDLELYIIPDPSTKRGFRLGRDALRFGLPPLRSCGILLLILVAASGLGLLFRFWGFTDASIITLYIFGAMLNAMFTRNTICSIFCSLGSVLLFNYFFTEPRYTLQIYASGSPVTFAIMLAAAILTATLARRISTHAKRSAQSAYRTQVLLEANRLLRQAEEADTALSITAEQLAKLLNRNVVVYGAAGGSLLPGRCFPDERACCLLEPQEQNAAAWVLQHRQQAGAGTERLSQMQGQYLAICTEAQVYGIVGIQLGSKTLEPFESDIVLSILGECALSIEKIRNAKEKEEAALLAQNEQLRADLLRAISHDLRTPLTSISGNAESLLLNGGALDEAARQQLLTDVRDDAVWLRNLVENLLSITRIGGGVRLRASAQLVDEVIAEALRHIDRHAAEHQILTSLPDTLLLADMDAQLICQVLVNLVDNAIKYTPVGSRITVEAEDLGSRIAIRVTDNGSGIPDAQKDRVFEMFYTGMNPVADCRRSLGLGLALCRTIVNAHGGDITVTDAQPSGCRFTFTLPKSEVTLHE